VALGLIVTAAILWIMRRRKGAADQAWRTNTRPLVAEAALARGLILDPPAPAAADRSDTVDGEIQRIVGQLDGRAREAPIPESGQAAANVSSAIQGLAYAVQAARLVRDPARVVTAEELEQADNAVTVRIQQLDEAISDLDHRTQPVDAGTKPNDRAEENH
jgi:hypothetical protein